MRTETFDTPSPINVDIRLPAGSISVEAADVATTTVELDARSDRGREAVAAAEISLRGDTLVIDVSQKKVWGLSIVTGGDYVLRVQCPMRSALHVKTAAADLEARGTLREARVASASGDVELETVDGDVEIKTASGDVDLPRVGGRARINSVSGDVTIGHVERELELRSVSGDVRVASAGSSVTANSVSGDQTLELVREGDVTLQTVSGDMTVRVAPGSRLWVDARSLSGDMRSDFAIGDEPTAVDGPLVELRAKSVSGDVDVSRASARV